MNNKLIAGIVGGILLLGAVAYGSKPELFSKSACSYKDGKKSCQSCCGSKEKKEKKQDKSGACCATKSTSESAE